MREDEGVGPPSGHIAVAVAVDSTAVAAGGAGSILSSSGLSGDQLV